MAKEKVLFEAEADDEIFMTSDFKIKKSIKNGLDFEHERQGGHIEEFTRDFLTEWLKNN